MPECCSRLVTRVSSRNRRAVAESGAYLASSTFTVTSPTGLVASVEKMGFATHRIKTDFDPKRFYHWVETLFLDYRKAHPDKPSIHSHQLRKRAFTKAYDAGVSQREASIAFGCTPDTMHRHDVALDEQAVTDKVLSSLAESLTPKAAAAEKK